MAAPISICSMDTPVCVSTCLLYLLKQYVQYKTDVRNQEKKEILPSPMAKTLIPTENSKTYGQRKNATATFDCTTIMFPGFVEVLSEFSRRH